MGLIVAGPLAVSVVEVPEGGEALLTTPNGANPCPSSCVFAPRFTKTWVVLVFGPASAKTTVPRAFVCRMGSSRMVAVCHACASSDFL